MLLKYYLRKKSKKFNTEEDIANRKKQIIEGLVDFNKNWGGYSGSDASWATPGTPAGDLAIEERAKMLLEQEIENDKCELAVDSTTDLPEDIVKAEAEPDFVRWMDSISFKGKGKNVSDIPEGQYCYKGIKDLSNRRLQVLNLCPYWEKTEIGAKCSFLNREDEYGDPFHLLWDQVKECGIKDED